MALKDEASPKYTFPGAGTSLLKSYKKLAPGSKTHGPKGRSESKICISRGRNVLSEILQKACCWCGNISFYIFKSCWLLLAAALLPLLLLLLLLLDSLLPLLLPRPLLWLLLQLPAAKHHGPKGRSESKICVSRGRNVPSENLQKACCWCRNDQFFNLFKSCWLLLAGC